MRGRGKRPDKCTTFQLITLDRSCARGCPVDVGRRATPFMALASLLQQAFVTSSHRVDVTMPSGCTFQPRFGALLSLSRNVQAVRLLSVAHTPRNTLLLSSGDSACREICPRDKRDVPRSSVREIQSSAGDDLISISSLRERARSRSPARDRQRQARSDESASEKNPLPAAASSA